MQIYITIVISVLQCALHSINATPNTNKTEFVVKTLADTHHPNNPTNPTFDHVEDERQDRFYGVGIGPYPYYYPSLNPYHINEEFAPNCGDSYPNRRYKCYGLGRR